MYLESVNDTHTYKHTGSMLIGSNGYTNQQLLDIKKISNGMDNKTHTQSPTNMDALVNEVRRITTVIEDQEKSDEIEGEWQTLAKVFDRLFFALFFFIFLVSSLVILVPSYAKHMNHSHGFS